MVVSVYLSRKKRVPPIVVVVQKIPFFESIEFVFIGKRYLIY